MVDNGSLDDVVDRVRVELPQVRIVEPLANTGFAGGCNLGITAPGEFDYVALVNNDATVDPRLAATARRRVRAARACRRREPEDAVRGPLRRGRAGRARRRADRPRPAHARHPAHRGAHRWRARRRPAGLRRGVVRAGAAVATRRRGDRPLVVAPRTRPRPGRTRTCPPSSSLRMTSHAPRQATLRTEHTAQTVDGRSRRRARGSTVALDGDPFDVINNAGSGAVRRAGSAATAASSSATAGSTTSRPRSSRGAAARCCCRRRTSTTSGCSTSACSSTTRTPTCRGAADSVGGATGTSRRRSSVTGTPRRRAGPARSSSATTPSATGCSCWPRTPRPSWRRGRGSASSSGPSASTCATWSCARSPCTGRSREDAAHQRRVLGGYLRLLPAMLRDRWRRAGCAATRRSLMAWTLTKETAR